MTLVSGEPSGTSRAFVKVEVPAVIGPVLAGADVFKEDPPEFLRHLHRVDANGRNFPVDLLFLIAQEGICPVRVLRYQMVQHQLLEGGAHGGFQIPSHRVEAVDQEQRVRPPASGLLDEPHQLGLQILFAKILDGRFAVGHSLAEQVGNDFKEMGFS